MRNKKTLIGLIILAAVLFSASIFIQPSKPAFQSVQPYLADDPALTPTLPSLIEAGTLPCDPSAVHGLYFYSSDCPHCMEVLNNVLLPMQNEFGTKLDIRLVEIDYADNYELLIKAEEYYGVKAEERAIPTLIIDGNVMIGVDEIQAGVRTVVEEGILDGGIEWPDIPDFDPSTIISEENASTSAEICSLDSSETCETGAPLYTAYFYQTGCDSCSRVEADLAYLRSRYPQMIVEKFNVYDHPGLGIWLAERAGRQDFHTPAVFIGSQAWIGEAEITPEAIEAALQCYQQEGSAKIWEAYDSEEGSSTIVAQFRSMSWLTVVFAGLVDGLNPCAFATLIFFISYLTLSGRKGREVILVGVSFTLGVFGAYLVIGLGLYKVLDLLGDTLNVLARWVYIITAALCLGLGIFSILDYFKARKGKLDDMSLKLPEVMRKRINKVIRKGRGSQAYFIGAFITGLFISILELACTGQVYLPTIIFVSSVPELKLRAIFYLVLYNLLFILPLVVVFILAYFGTTSKELTKFLHKHAAAVKIGMAALFFILAAWLLISVL
jgi:cytochrome c biogenesis protein CcdA/thiol-disulfide isomerase/thioredoxin